MVTHSSILAWRCTGSSLLLELSLVAVCEPPRCSGFSVAEPGPQDSWASAAVAHGLSCPAACGIFLDQGSSLCPLHWQVGSYPLCHQGSPGSLTPGGLSKRRDRRILSGSCPDPKCQARLFFPASGSVSIECTECGQRHEQQQLLGVEEVTDPDVVLHNLLRNALLGVTGLLS